MAIPVTIYLPRHPSTPKPRPRPLSEGAGVSSYIKIRKFSLCVCLIVMSSKTVGPSWVTACNFSQYMWNRANALTTDPCLRGVSTPCFTPGWAGYDQSCKSSACKYVWNDWSHWRHGMGLWARLGPTWATEVTQVEVTKMNHWTILVTNCHVQQGREIHW